MINRYFLILWLLSQGSAFGQTRNNDPVVVKGSSLSCMIGVQPSLIVAYRFNGSSLVQIPVQVDEVVVKEASAPYNNLG
ncbi:MAG: hypothetical protein ACKOKB_03715, partial [Bacteroidota bacterium]